MEETDTLQTLPPNFISLQKLQELRIKEKQQKQQQQDDEDTKKRLAEAAAELERGKLVVVSDEIKNTASAKGFYKKKKKKKLGHRPKLQEQELGAAAIEEPVVDLDQESKQNMKAKMKKKKKKNREKEGESMVEKQTEVGKGGESAAEITRSVNPTVEVTLDKEKPKSNGWKKKTMYRNRNSSGTADIGNIAVSGDSGGNKRSSRSSKIEIRNGDFMKGRRKGGENLMWVKKEGIKSDGGDAN
ncbi:hypothetical protein ACHQM5_024855 [Ranunculus cassubicifolius]